MRMTFKGIMKEKLLRIFAQRVRLLPLLRTHFPTVGFQINEQTQASSTSCHTA